MIDRRLILSGILAALAGCADPSVDDPRFTLPPAPTELNEPVKNLQTIEEQSVNPQVNQ